MWFIACKGSRRGKKIFDYLKGIKKCENKIVRNKLVRIVSQIFYMSAELVSANRGVWLGSAEFISAISEFLRKFADFICVFPDVFTSYFFIQP